MADAIEWVEDPDWAKLAAARTLAEVAVARMPGAAGAWKNLILAQKRMGKMAEAQETIARASVAIGGDRTARKAFLAALLELEEYERALAEGEALTADDDAVRALLRDAAIRSNRLGPAECRVLMQQDYTVNQAWGAARDAGDLSRLVAQCRAELAENPIHTDARFILAHALAKLGADAAARATMAIDVFPRIAMLDGDGETGAALASELRVNPTLVQDPHNKATRDGLQAARIGLPGEPAVKALLARIKGAIERYCASVDGIDDPYMAARPARAKLSSWAVIYGAAGRQSPHRHPGGWLSGVYHVSAPHDADGYRGALLLGEPDQRLGKAPPWPVRRVAPVPGRLVLFPSFTPHATESCGAAGERISVAFDVIPFEAKATP
ncbi:MAG TPA: putative 2OG-Fe(II) oxygenase [Rhizomicrobium sp.]|jgi:hypothetical protein|nr:putative 2OG-Fe(II) oxygenase [Rhizomicrobium sp.]